VEDKRMKKQIPVFICNICKKPKTMRSMSLPITFDDKPICKGCKKTQESKP
jgi:hypothetical protein